MNVISVMSEIWYLGDAGNSIGLSVMLEAVSVIGSANYCGKTNTN